MLVDYLFTCAGTTADPVNSYFILFYWHGRGIGVYCPDFAIASERTFYIRSRSAMSETTLQ